MIRWFDIPFSGYVTIPIEDNQSESERAKFDQAEWDAELFVRDAVEKALTITTPDNSFVTTPECRIDNDVHELEWDEEYGFNPID